MHIMRFHGIALHRLKSARPHMQRYEIRVHTGICELLQNCGRKVQPRSRRGHTALLSGIYGLVAFNVRIFGSVARGEAGPESDIDFLVEMEPGRTLLDHAGLWIDLQELLGCEVDVVVEPGLKPRIKDRVMRDAVAL